MKSAKPLILIILLAAVFLFFAQYTDNFTGELKEFYVKHNGKVITENQSGFTFAPNTEYTFYPRYTLGIVTGQKPTFEIYIRPTPGIDFDFTADGNPYNYGAQQDFTHLFNVSQGENITISTNKAGLSDLLKAALKVEEVILPELDFSRDYLQLVIVSGKHEIVIGFNLTQHVTGIELEPGGIVF